jgi:enoyl-CoA hydratase
MSESTAAVNASREGGVFRITLNRPESLNSVNDDLVEQLEAAVDAAAADPQVRVVVLSGNGRGFCSGADLKRERKDSAGDSVLDRANRIVQKLSTMDKPVVGAINGAAAGVGCSFALACDLVVAAPDAYFLLAFTNIGLMPDGGATALVPALVGRARAQEMALLGQKIPGPKAEQWGLIYHAATDADDFDTTVQNLIARFTEGPPLAFGLTKQAVNAATLDLLTAAQAREVEGQMGTLIPSNDFKEAVVAFKEKRKATFNGN